MLSVGIFRLDAGFGQEFAQAGVVFCPILDGNLLFVPMLQYPYNEPAVRRASWRAWGAFWLFEGEAWQSGVGGDSKKRMDAEIAAEAVLDSPYAML